VTALEVRDRSVTFVTPVQHRAVDLLRVGLQIDAVGPEHLEEALARPGCVVVDVLKRDTWSPELQAVLRDRVADVVLLVAEGVTVSGLGPEEGCPQLEVVTAPVLAGDVAEAVRALWGEDEDLSPAVVLDPEESAVAEVAAQDEPDEPDAEEAAATPRPRWFARRPARTEVPVHRVVDLVKAEAVLATPAPPAAPSAAPPAPPPAPSPPRPPSWDDAVRAVLAHLEHAETWTQVAERMVHDAAGWTETDTALLLRDGHGTWVPVAGAGLRQLEYALVLHDLHPAVQMTSPDQPVVVVPDTDALRGVIAQMPLASRRSLLLARVPGVAALLLAGTSSRVLVEEDVARVGQVVTHLAGPLQDALRRRDFAAAVQHFL
jgi:hypothetical protein